MRSLQNELLLLHLVFIMLTKKKNNMHTIPIESLDKNISSLIKKAINGEEVIFSDKEKPVAKIEPLPNGKKQRKFGSAKGTILYMAEDFDDTPEDFKEYI